MVTKQEHKYSIFPQIYFKHHPESITCILLKIEKAILKVTCQCLFLSHHVKEVLYSEDPEFCTQLSSEDNMTDVVKCLLLMYVPLVDIAPLCSACSTNYKEY